MSRNARGKIHGKRAEDGPVAHRHQLIWTSMVALGVIASALFQVSSPGAFRIKTVNAAVAAVAPDSSWALRKPEIKNGRKALQPRSPSSVIVDPTEIH